MPEPIEWYVLEKDENKAFLVSKYALDYQKYNKSIKQVKWETCSLRKRLNETFINNAFSPEEQKQLLCTKISSEDEPSHFSDAGGNTTDKIFLLSIPEVNKYFKSDNNRRCVPTDYARSNINLRSEDGKQTCCWWLRSLANNSLEAPHVEQNGKIRSSCYCVNSKEWIRPALWIELNS